jgi:xanthine/uracil/vitamin C permease (AzgA family)
MSARLTSAAFAATGVLFLLYPAVRPSTDDAAAMASGAWVVGHLAAMIGFVLLGLAVLGLHHLLGDRLSLRAAVVTRVGVGLTLPYYGAEDFGLNVIANRSLRDNAPALMELAEQFRYGPVAMTMFAGGLLLLGVGAVMAAVSVWRSGTPARWSGVPLAVGFALFVPQFFGPYSLRIAHGALIAIGGVWLAVELWRARGLAPQRSAVR